MDNSVKVRVTTRWGGIENVFTMIVHLWQILADVSLTHLVTPGNCCSRAAYATTAIVLIHIMAHGIYLHKQYSIYQLALNVKSKEFGKTLV